MSVSILKDFVIPYEGPQRQSNHSNGFHTLYYGIRAVVLATLEEGGCGSSRLRGWGLPGP